MGYLRKMRYNQQSEPPHLYTFEFNPLSRNPGSTPVGVVCLLIPRGAMSWSVIVSFPGHYTRLRLTSVNITGLGLTNPDVNLKRMHQLFCYTTLSLFSLALVFQ